MKVDEIIVRLFDNKRGVTLERVKKAQALTQRSKIKWDDVLTAMNTEQRAAVEGAQQA